MPELLDTLQTAVAAWAAAAPGDLSEMVAVALAHPIVSFEAICVGAVVFCARTGARI